MSKPTKKPLAYLVWLPPHMQFEYLLFASRANAEGERARIYDGGHCKRWPAIVPLYAKDKAKKPSRPNKKSAEFLPEYRLSGRRLDRINCDDKGHIDEIVVGDGKKLMLHIEQMSDNQYWGAIYAGNKTYTLCIHAPKGLQFDLQEIDVDVVRKEKKV